MNCFSYTGFISIKYTNKIFEFLCEMIIHVLQCICTGMFSDTWIWRRQCTLISLVRKLTFQMIFFSRVKVKTMAFSRNPRPIQSTRNLRQTHHPWTYKYSINLETYIQMWVVNCRSSFDVGGFKSRFCFFLRS